MAVKELAETVILQSIEDLWDKEQRKECGTFFCSQGFSFWADVAGMKISDKRKVLSIFLGSITKTKRFTQSEYILDTSDYGKVSYM